MVRTAALFILATALILGPASASQTRPNPCRKACAGWKFAECMKACEVGATSEYKQREKRNTHCKATNTTWEGAKAYIARARRIEVHGR